MELLVENVGDSVKLTTRQENFVQIQDWTNGGRSLFESQQRLYFLAAPFQASVLGDLAMGVVQIQLVRLCVLDRHVRPVLRKDIPILVFLQSKFVSPRVHGTKCSAPKLFTHIVYITNIPSVPAIGRGMKASVRWQQ